MNVPKVRHSNKLFWFQFHADSSSTLPCPLTLKVPFREPESDGCDGMDSAGIFVHESTQVRSILNYYLHLSVETRLLGTELCVIVCSLYFIQNVSQNS